LSSNSVAIHDLPDLVIHSLPDMWPRAIFSRDYCRDIGDSARIAEDEQEHELFTGKRFHRPSISLFRNSNVVNYALIGGAPHGQSYRPLPLRSLAGWGQGLLVLKHRTETTNVKPVFKEVKLNRPNGVGRDAPPSLSVLKSERY
jgi:hypothetical protein